MQDINPLEFNKNALIELVTTKMPYGKFKGRRLCDLPEFYIVWYHRKGFPPGKLGALLHTMYEIKLNGLEYLLKPFITK
ncbi:MAG: hypothetical protein CVT98_07710 [Bacteroidetes bacterium HGW-Bacteroidetes-15]|nr:MAG: hypothetical protein CVT98_07710 [Bacteroidetes bacterium HGW-Bacteroidetes-15]